MLCQGRSGGACAGGGSGWGEGGGKAGGGESSTTGQPSEMGEEREKGTFVIDAQASRLLSLFPDDDGGNGVGGLGLGDVGWSG